MRIEIHNSSESKGMATMASTAKRKNDGQHTTGPINKMTRANMNKTTSITTESLEKSFKQMIKEYGGMPVKINSARG